MTGKTKAILSTTAALAALLLVAGILISSTGDKSEQAARRSNRIEKRASDPFSLPSRC